MNNATTRTSAAEMVAAARERYGGDPVDPDTFVYFVQMGEDGPIKVGQTTKPLQRLESLQNGNPYPLRFTRIEIWPGSQECYIHGIFKDYRLRGEWFRRHPALAAIADVAPDPDLIGSALAYESFQRSRPGRRPRPASAGLDGDVLTFRPEPDEDGWRSAS
jgi:hypothetical protein